MRSFFSGFMPMIVLFISKVATIITEAVAGAADPTQRSRCCAIRPSR